MQKPPKILAWYKGYCWLAAGLKLGLALGGLGLILSNEWWITTTAETGTTIPNWLMPVMGAVVISIFLPMAVVTAWLPSLPVKKSTWQVHFTCLVMGCCTIALLPFALPVLIGWMKPDVKSWYQQN